MTMKNVILKQYRENVNAARSQVSALSLPSEGWIRTVRKAFGMSGAQLARRRGVTRALISKTEKAELEGGVTLRAMQSMAESMNCRFIYAIVPEQEIETILRQRALEKASAVVNAASIQMALEEQALSKDKLQEQIRALAKEMIDKASADLWDDI